MRSIEGNIVDLQGNEIFPGRLHLEDGIISQIERLEGSYPNFIIPGFVDAHIHIESTMLAPAEFSRAAAVHGTVATVSDPHEIANVLGEEGVRYMISEGRRGKVKICYGAPSCVPATVFETAGATLDAKAVARLMAERDIYYLSEVMNFPGVLNGDPDLLAKIAAAKALGKPVDGHAPQLRHPQAASYAAAGISTDHECTTLQEAHDKIEAGMHILIREGSAARNYDALEPLLFSHPERCMFCSDDLHPDALAIGHINLLVRRAVAAGVPPLTALRIASLNPVRHYKLPVGLLGQGDPADFLVVEDLKDFRVLQTWIDGEAIAGSGSTPAAFQAPALINRFAASPVTPAALQIPCDREEVRVEIIAIEDGQLVTGRESHLMRPENGFLKADLGRDLLKIVVVNRYQSVPPAIGFITNFGLTSGAIASSVAHDSHNIVAVGASDEALCQAINLIIAHQGGVCAVSGETEKLVPLPIAGLMSDQDADTVARGYAGVEALARSLGSPLRAPLMTLSFMALLVIPELKLSDKGLFDGTKFEFVPLIGK